MLSNSIGIFSLLGLIMVLINGSKLSEGATPITFTVIGAIFVIMWIVNWQFKRSSQYNQGLFDLMFGAYLVKHVPSESEENLVFGLNLRAWEIMEISSLLEEKQKSRS